ncbi:ABC transporter substrate-binding protein [Falsiroseomonas sp. HW251]|uniref:ABC transporter substrate-binding protein n=1 Tax=Falsiroseomonas sp. HW251 TaxID=3390998 RepID=UPI003D31BA20
MTDQPLLSRRAAMTLAAGSTILARAAFAQDEAVRFGSIFALAGPNASIGREALGGAEYAMRKLNAEGVEIAGRRRRFELLNVDDESRTERSVAAAERLITRDNVPVLLTPVSSTTTLAVLPIAERNKRLAMSFVAAAPQVVSPENPFSFRNTLTATMNVAPSVEYLAKERNARTIAYLGRNDDWGRAAGREIKERAQALGARVVVEEYFEPGSTDFFGLLTRVRAANPDAVIGAAFTEDGVAMLRQYRELRMRPIFLSVAVIWASPVFINAAGDNLNGVLIASGPTTADTPELAAFREEFQRATGSAPLPYNTTAYDTVRLVVAAMQAAGSTDPERVADRMRNFEYKGVLQTYRFSNGNQSQVLITINEVTNRQVRVVSSLMAT